MDTIEFIQQKEGITKHEAIKKAESLLNGAATTKHPTIKPMIQPENLNEIFIKLKQSLYSNSKARAYRNSSGIWCFNFGNQ